MKAKCLLLLAAWAASLALGSSVALRAAETATVTGALNVKDFGATGDGKTLDTEAINRAIEAASAAGGGTVYLPAGTYASYSIHLKSNVALYLGPGATLLAADPPAEGEPGGYDPPEPNEFDKYQDFGHSHWHNSLIWGENLENVSILGPGRIFGRGLARNYAPKDPLPSEGPGQRPPANEGPVTAEHPFGYPSQRDTLRAGVGNKSIALKNCRNVLLRDFTVFHGGHFVLWAVATDNLTIDNLTLDTNRDGLDIDCCRNVRVSNCSINSPTDDGICLKSSFALGYARPTENVTIVNCLVSGYAEGTLLDGTCVRSDDLRKVPGRPTGRIKLGTEANGGFKNITIANCVFDYCRGLALEEVDGGLMEDISISNLTMRTILNAPIFIRLGARQRGPNHPPVGEARRINISNVVASDVAPEHGIVIAGVPGHAVEDVSLSNIRILYRGGGTAADAVRTVPELETGYPEPERFGTLPSWGLFARHVQGLRLTNIELAFEKPELRPAVMLDDVKGAEFRFLNTPRVEGQPTFVLKNVEDFNVQQCRPVPDTRWERAEEKSL